mmetsp:Transcript_8419/g.9612  ORF Transcript_8419/g.9612 Transcript_8419/m.9612 type:complete len:235 (-) Transcript_8419:144-848(-)
MFSLWCFLFRFANNTAAADSKQQLAIEADIVAAVLSISNGPGPSLSASVGLGVDPVGFVEVTVGDLVGLVVGLSVGLGDICGGSVGFGVGDSVGFGVAELRVGFFVGLGVGNFVGLVVGAFVGLLVGVFVGLGVGVSVGLFVGDSVGLSVAVTPSQVSSSCNPVRTLSRKSAPSTTIETGTSQEIISPAAKIPPSACFVELSPTVSIQDSPFRVQFAVSTDKSAEFAKSSVMTK